MINQKNHWFYIVVIVALNCMLDFCEADFITELAAYRNRRSFKSKLENLFPTEHSGRCVTSPKSGRDICYPDIASLDYSCVSKNGQDGHKSVPPPRIVHGQYKALITKFRPHHATRVGVEPPVAKPFLVVQYECHEGFELLDEAEFLFCREYKWLQTAPVCIPKNAVAEYRRKSNPCQESNGGCSHICKFISGSKVECDCPTGWDKQEDEKTCTELEPCQVNNAGCSHFCESDQSEDRGFKCTCPEGFMLRTDEKTCIEEIHEIAEFLPEKPGLCPQVPFGHPDSRCASHCRRDQDCQGKGKCCTNGCANVCMEPEPGSDLISRPIPECTSTEGCRCVVLDESRQRCQCPQSILCHITRSPPEVMLSPQGPLEIRPGSSLNLTCQASGYPHANVSWFRDGVPMEKNGADGINGNGGVAQHDKTTTKRLLIKELFKSTVFTCEAVNEVGSNTMGVEVIVTGPGSPPVNIQAKVTGISVTIRWVPPTLPNGRIKGYQVYYIAKDARKPLRQWKTVGTMDPRITLENLDQQTRYFFRVMPFNERGSGILTNIFSVKTDKPETAPVVKIIEGNLIELEPGESVNLTCNVLGGWPMPQVAWFQEGARLQEYSVLKSLTFQFQNADESKSFECRALNAKGSSNATVKVEVLGPGRAPGQIQYRVDGTDVEMSWGSPQFPNGEIKGYIIYYTIDAKAPLENWDVEMVHHKQATTLKDLKAQTTYYSKIKAFNHRGSGPTSETFSFKTDLQNMAPKVRLLDRSTRVEVAPFGSVNLTCAASGQPEPTLKWTQDGETVRSFGQAPPFGNETQRSIFIQRIVESTIFTCQATNHVGSDSLRVDVVVMGPGSPPENIELKSVENTVHLKWQEPYITNGPITAYTVYFTMDRSLPISNWSRFEIPSSGFQSEAILRDLEEEAVYFMKIAGKTAQGDGLLSQPYQVSTGRKILAPEASLNPPDQRVSLKFDESYSVTCTAIGHPEPKLVWHRDGQPVGFRTIADDAKSISAVLTVENLSTSSLFECKAENDLGSSIVKVQIDIIGPGSPPTSITYLPYSTNIALHWEPPDVPNGEITGYEIAYATESEQQISHWSSALADISREHRITGLQPYQRYILRMRALNQKGPGPWTPAFNVTTGPIETLPQISLMPNVSVLTVPPGSTVNVTCTAEGFPHPMVTWLENGQPVSHDSGSEVTVVKEKVFEPTIFECKATNIFGTSSASVGIHVAGPGEPPLKFLGDAQGLSVHVSWVPPRITNGMLKSFVVYYSPDPSADISRWKNSSVPVKPVTDKSPFYDLTIKDLPPSTTLYFKIRAVSDKGQGVLSAPITAMTEERDYFLNISVQPSETVEMPVNGSVELRCFGEGYPLPKVSWRMGDKIVVEPKPRSNAIFLDHIAKPMSVECFVTSAAGTAIKAVHIFPSERIESICRPVQKLLDGMFLIGWKDAKETFKTGSNFTVLYTNQPELPLHLWNSIETNDPSHVFFSTLQPGENYSVRLKVIGPDGHSFVVCSPATMTPPRMPKQVSITRAKNRTVITWGKIKIPDKKIEKIHVYYTYEIDKPFDKWDRIMVPPNAEEISLTDIKPSTDYLIKLEFVTDQGEKVYSLQYEIKSPEFEYTICELANCSHDCLYDQSTDLTACRCPDGHVLSKNNRTCFEFGLKSSCDVENGGCDQICHDPSEGSSESSESSSESLEESQNGNVTTVKCSCFDGFDLQPDNVTCLASLVTTTSTAALTTTISGDHCLQPLDIGTCAGHSASWYFDPEFGACSMFAFTGCGGNANRFETRLACMDACSPKACHALRRELAPLSPSPASQRHDVTTQTKVALQSPQCDETTGSFAPLQCDMKGDECWCVDPLTGREVDGSRLNVKQAGGRPYCSACQFEYQRLINEADPESFVPSCSAEGHYSLVQCHARTGECWCVDQLTGAELDGSRVPLTTKVSCPLAPTKLKPENFRVSLTDDDRLKFSFEFKPADAAVKKYLLYYVVDEAGDTLRSPGKWFAVKVDKDFSPHGFERPNFLRINKTYSIKLAAMTDTGLTNYSDTIQLKAIHKIPPQPSIIRIESLVPNSVRVAWNRTPNIDSPDITLYNAYVENLDTGARELFPGIHALTNLSLNLQPLSNYAVSISALGHGGESPRSNRILFRTQNRTVTTTPTSPAAIPSEVPEGFPGNLSTHSTEVDEKLGSTLSTIPSQSGATLETIKFLTSPPPLDKATDDSVVSPPRDELVREEETTKNPNRTKGSLMPSATPTTAPKQPLTKPALKRILPKRTTPTYPPASPTTPLYLLMTDPGLTGAPPMDANRLQRVQWKRVAEFCASKFNQSKTRMADVVFITDVSNRDRQKDDYDATVDGILDIVEVLLNRQEMGGARKKGAWSAPFRIAYMHVGEKVETPVSLEMVYNQQQQDINRLVELVRDTEHLKGGDAGKVADALYKSRDILRGPGSRPEAEKHVILISDGGLTSEAVEQATERLNDLSIDLVGVGLSPEAEREMQSILRGSEVIFGAQNISDFHLTVAPKVLQHLCLPPFDRKEGVVPALSVINVTKGVFVTQNDIEINWVADETYNIQSFEVTFTNLKDNSQQKLIVGKEVRSLTLSGLPFEDHVIFVKPTIKGPVPENQVFMPVIVYKDSYLGKKLIPATIPSKTASTPSIRENGKKKFTDILYPTPDFSVANAKDFSGPFSTTSVVSSTPPEPLITTERSADFESPGVTPYSTFTRSIPTNEIQVAPTCNCTCQTLIKLRRSQCFYDADSSGDQQEEITIDLDQVIQNAKSSSKSAKNCSGEQSGIEISSGRGSAQIEPGVARDLQAVPKDQEGDCPCVVPMQGDACPPGFSLKFGKCRDIDECAYKNGGCSHGCVNTMGSYYCACPPGMYRDLADPKRCLDQHNYFKRLGQLLHQHLYNEMQAQAHSNSSASEGQSDKQTAHPSGTNGTGKAVVSMSSDKKLKFEWEWSQYLKRRRRFLSHDRNRQ